MEVLFDSWPPGPALEAYEAVCTNEQFAAEWKAAGSRLKDEDYSEYAIEEEDKPF